MHARIIGGNGRVIQESWTDVASPSSQRSRALIYDQAGHVAEETTVSLQGRTVRHDIVDYLNKTWQTQTFAVPPSATNSGVTNYQYFPSELRRLVRLKLIGPVGHRKIGGIDTILLQGQLGPNVFRVWVRPVSYLAVQSRTVAGNGSPSGFDLIRFDWLGPDAESETVLSVPPGFVHDR